MLEQQIAPWPDAKSSLLPLIRPPQPQFPPPRREHTLFKHVAPTNIIRKNIVSLSLARDRTNYAPQNYKLNFAKLTLGTNLFSGAEMPSTNRVSQQKNRDRRAEIRNRLERLVRDSGTFMAEDLTRNSLGDQRDIHDGLKAQGIRSSIPRFNCQQPTSFHNLDSPKALLRRHLKKGHSKGVSLDLKQSINTSSSVSILNYEANNQIKIKKKTIRQRCEYQFAKKRRIMELISLCKTLEVQDRYRQTEPDEQHPTLTESLRTEKKPYYPRPVNTKRKTLDSQRRSLHIQNL